MKNLLIVTLDTFLASIQNGYQPDNKMEYLIVCDKDASIPVSLCNVFQKEDVKTLLYVTGIDVMTALPMLVGYYSAKDISVFVGEETYPTSDNMQIPISYEVMNLTDKKERKKRMAKTDRKKEFISETEKDALMPGQTSIEEFLELPKEEYKKETPKKMVSNILEAVSSLDEEFDFEPYIGSIIKSLKKAKDIESFKEELRGQLGRVTGPKVAAIIGSYFDVLKNLV